MSKVYILAKDGKNQIVLEVPSAKAGEQAFHIIKEKFPDVDIAVYGAKNINTLRRTHREMPGMKIFRDFKRFMQILSSKQAELTSYV
jgi:hypothetical protein